MYTFTLTMFAIIAVLSGLLFAADKLIDRYIFEPYIEDFSDMGEE